MITFKYSFEELDIDGDLYDVDVEVEVDPHDAGDWHIAHALLNYENPEGTYRSSEIIDPDQCTHLEGKEKELCLKHTKQRLREIVQATSADIPGWLEFLSHKDDVVHAYHELKGKD